MPVIIYGIAIFLFSTLLGVFTFAASDLPLAVREIALNTRRKDENGSQYAFLRILSVTIKVFAVLAWISGILIAFLLVYYKRLPA